MNKTLPLSPLPQLQQAAELYRSGRIWLTAGETKQPTSMSAPPAWQYPVYFPPNRFPASDAKPYPPALPIHTPQTTLWRLDPEKPSRRKHLRRQRTFKYK